MAGKDAAQGSLGVWACTCLVIGNVVGSGFFLAPAALAPYGTVALIGWLVMSVGAMCLGLVFARLGRIAPAAGGPYAYTRMGFGEFAGFLIAWGYWISMWASQPAIALAFVGYLRVFFPGLSDHPILNLLLALAAMWAVALVNMRGVKEAGQLQILMVSVKLVPFLGVALIGLVWVDWSHFTPINPTPDPFFVALSATAPLTMFAFLGIESATVPAGDVRDPKRTIFLSTVIGTATAALIFTLGTLVVMGVMGRTALAQSSAPFADAASIMWGPWAGYVIAAAAMLSSLGALNGWTLMMSQVPMAAARNGVLPQVFADLNANGVPARGIAISVGLSSLLLTLQTSGAGALIAVYDFVVELSTVAEMIPYVFCCLVEGALYLTLGRRIGYFSPRTYLPIAFVAFLFAMWTIYGSGPTAGMWGLLLLLSGLPIYILLHHKRAGTDAAQSSAAD
ncbi:amino acid permease [Aquabacter spiritensis]|uniref:Arginine/agmatine antiporter n=1 Tax=Aquabacter spiritensis TaxID=933073 RepID=A0A4R3M2B7_9HYPH|nr:amino acid permease [Aquabacter spiritensis]TCT06803.1 amino acid/polyamine/organocation transporter (APC superfamily) [Aquabacter spiritensis]